MNSRNSLEEVKRMREAAIKRAKATQAKSQIDLNSSRLEFDNSIEENMPSNKNAEYSKKSNNLKKDENIGFKSTNIPVSSKSNNKLQFESIINILRDVLQDTDKTLILVLIFLLMDNEENFPILLVLFYLLI